MAKFIFDAERTQRISIEIEADDLETATGKAECAADDKWELVQYSTELQYATNVDTSQYYTLEHNPMSGEEEWELDD